MFRSAWPAPSCPSRSGCTAFRDWSCASRWARYAEGQRVLLFLTAPEAASQPYTILSAGGEGEMPILDQQVILRGYRVAWLEAKEWKIDGNTLTAPAVALPEVRQAIVSFHATFAIEKKQDRERIATIRPSRSLADTEGYAARSRLAHHLHRRVTRSDAWSPLPAAQAK